MSKSADYGRRSQNTKPDLGGARKLRDLGVEVRTLMEFEGH